MALETDLKAALDPLVSGRVYPDVTPDNPTLPCIVYQQVGGEAINILDGSLPDRNNARVQIHVWAKTRVEASSVTQQVRANLTSQLAAASLGAPTSLYEEPLKLYGSRSFYGIWYAP